MIPKVVFLLLASSVLGANYERFNSASMSEEEMYRRVRSLASDGDAPPSEDDLVFVGSPLFPGPAAPGYSGAPGGHGMPRSPGAPYKPHSSRTKRSGQGPPSYPGSPVGEHGMPSSPGGDVDYGSPLYPGPAQPGFSGSPGGHGMPTSPGAPYIPHSRQTRGGEDFGGSNEPSLPGHSGSPVGEHGMPSSPGGDVDYGSPLYPGPAQPGFSGSPGGHGMPTSPGAPYIPHSRQTRGGGDFGGSNEPPSPGHSGSPVGEHGMPSSPGGDVNYGSPLYPGPAQPGFSGSPGGHGMPTSPGAPYIPQSSRTRSRGIGGPVLRDPPSANP